MIFVFRITDRKRKERKLLLGSVMETRKTVDPDVYRLINFVPSSGVTSEETGNKKSTQPKSQLSGKDIRAFYEELVSETSSSHVADALQNQVFESEGKPQKERSLSRKSERLRISHKGKRRSSESKPNKVGFDIDKSKHPESEPPSLTLARQRKCYKFLQSAQIGDTENLLKLLQSSSVDVNYSDFYGWTALMCAAHAGQLGTVMICLEHGADKTITNNKRQTAYDLANSAGFVHIASAIAEFNNNSSKRDSSRCSNEEEATFMCEICKAEFSVSEKPSHFSSTVHLFNLGHKPASASYLIPESNKGFQMLVRKGWDTRRGLGRHGEGQKYPVKTVLKQDRSGFGANVSNSGKVTHFNPRDKSAIELTMSQKGTKRSLIKIAKSVAKAKEKRDRCLEKKLRYEFADYC